MGTQPQPAGVRKVTFINTSLEVMPAYAVVQIGAPSSLNGRLIFSGSKYSGGEVVYFNGPTTVAVGAAGEAFQPNTAQWVLYDTGETPAFEEDWGPVSGSWLLGKTGSGFLIMGGATSGRVLAVHVPSEETHFEGYLCSDLSAAESIYNSPSTAQATRLIKNPATGHLTESTAVTITNRDTTLTLEAGTYIVWTVINGENRIVWAACQAEISSSCPVEE